MPTVKYGHSGNQELGLHIKALVVCRSISFYVVFYSGHRVGIVWASSGLRVGFVWALYLGMDDKVHDRVGQCLVYLECHWAFSLLR